METPLTQNTNIGLAGTVPRLQFDKIYQAVVLKNIAELQLTKEQVEQFETLNELRNYIQTTKRRLWSQNNKEKMKQYYIDNKEHM